MSNYKKLLLLILIITLLMITSAIFVLNTKTGNHIAMIITGIIFKHKKAYQEKPEFTMNVENLIQIFNHNLSDAMRQYNGKIILLSGQVTNIENNNISLNNGVVCILDSTQIDNIKHIKVNDQIKIQGRLVTYNDLLGEIDLDGCGIK